MFPPGLLEPGGFKPKPKLYPVELSFAINGPKPATVITVKGYVEQFDFHIQTKQVSSLMLKIVQASMTFDQKEKFLPSILEKCLTLSSDLTIWYSGVSEIETKGSDVIIDFVHCRFFKDMKNAKAYLVAKELKK